MGIVESFSRTHGYEPAGSGSKADLMRRPEAERVGWSTTVSFAEVGLASSRRRALWRAVIDDPTPFEMHLIEQTQRRSWAARFGLMQDLILHDPELDDRFIVQSDVPLRLDDIHSSGALRGLLIDETLIEVHLTPAGSARAPGIPAGTSMLTLEVTGSSDSLEWLDAAERAWRALLAALWRDSPSELARRLKSVPLEAFEEEGLMWDGLDVLDALLQGNVSRSHEAVPGLGRVLVLGEHAHALRALELLEQIDDTLVVAVAVEGCHRHWSWNETDTFERARRLAAEHGGLEAVEALEATMNGQPRVPPGDLCPPYIEALGWIVRGAPIEVAARAATGIAAADASRMLETLRRRAYRLDAPHSESAQALRRAIIALERRNSGVRERPRSVDIAAHFAHAWKTCRQRLSLREVPGKPPQARAVRTLEHDGFPHTLVVEVGCRGAKRLADVVVTAVIQIVFYDSRGARLIPSLEQLDMRLRETDLLDRMGIGFPAPADLLPYYQRLRLYAPDVRFELGNRVGAVAGTRHLKSLEIHVDGSVSDLGFVDVAVEVALGLLNLIVAPAQTLGTVAGRAENAPRTLIRGDEFDWWDGPAFREVALRRLGAFDDPWADDLLVRALTDREPRFRAVAAETLSAERHGPRVAAPLLHRAIEVGDPRNAEAVRFLEQVGWHVAHQAYQECLAEGRTDVRLTVAQRQAVIAALADVIAEAPPGSMPNAEAAREHLEQLLDLPQSAPSQERASRLPRPATPAEKDSDRLPRPASEED